MKSKRLSPLNFVEITITRCDLVAIVREMGIHLGFTLD
jgi:hypothetical protein